MANVAINVEVRSNGEVVLGRLGSQLEDVGKKADRAKTQMEKFSDLMGEGLGVASGIAMFEAAKGAVTGLINAVKEAADWSENLGKAVRVTGLSAESFQKLTTSATEMGYSAEDVTGVMLKLNKAVEEADPALKQLGLSYEALRNMSPEERMQATALALTNVGDASTQTALAMQIYGKSGAELLPLLDQIASGAYKMNAALGAEQVAALDKADAALDKFGSAWDLAKKKAVSAIVSISDWWNKNTVEKPLQKLGLLGNGLGMSKEQFAQFNAPNRNLDTSELSLGPETPAQKAAVAAYKERQKLAEEASKKEADEQKKAADLRKRFAEGAAKSLYQMTEKYADDTLKSQLWHLDKLGDAQREGAQKLAEAEKQTNEQRKKSREEVLAEVLAQEERAAQRYQEIWTNVLQGIALLAGAIGGRMGDAINVVGNIGASLKDWKTMSGQQKFGAIASGVGQIGGLVGGKTGGFLSGAAGGAMTGMAIGGPWGAAIGGVIGGIAGLFGAGKKKKAEEKARRDEELKQFGEMTKALEQQYGSLENADRAAHKYGVSLKEALDTKNPKLLDEALKMVEKRMAGMRTAVEGLKGIIDNLTYKDASGKILQTFSDPEVAKAAAGSFSSTFWALYQREGIAAVEQLRPQWEALLDSLQKQGVDAVGLGLGRVGRLMDLASDPKAKALLGVSAGSAQLLKGSMDAGFMDRGLLADQTTLARATLGELQKTGMSAEEAAQAQEAQLAALAQAYKATGQQLPDDLAEAMKAAGIDVLPTTNDLLTEIRDILKGAPGYRSGGVDDFGRGSFAKLHGDEAIVPLDSRGNPTGPMGDRFATPFPVPVPTTTTATTVVFSPKIDLPPHTSKESVEAAARATTQEFERSLRSNPRVQRYVDRIAENAARRVMSGR